MSKTTGLGDRFFLDGYNLSGDIGAVQSIMVSRELIDVTGIDKDAYERLGGLGDSKIEFNNWFNPSSGQAHPVLDTLADTRHVIYSNGSVAGKPAAAMVGTQASYEVQRGNDGSLSGSVSVENKSGDLIDWGVLLVDGPKIVTTTGNQAGVDNGSTTDDELHAYLQVLAFTGTNITFTLQHSLTDASYVALTGGAFTQVTAAPAKERIEVAGPIRNWLRVAITGTFSSCTFVIAVSRKGSSGVLVEPAVVHLVITTYAPTVTVV